MGHPKIDFKLLKLPPAGAIGWSWPDRAVQGIRWQGHHVTFSELGAPEPNCDRCDPSALAPLATRRVESSVAALGRRWARVKERDEAVKGLVDIAAQLHP